MTEPERELESECIIEISGFKDGGVGRDVIPALTDPKFVTAQDPEADYLLPDDRIIGFQFGNRTFAIPHNILWWHEIINLNLPEGRIAVTYCPLTGTAMAFDRSTIAGAELGVSGLLFMNNLVMFDRSSVESLFPQMLSKGVCGLRKRVLLPRIAVTEMTWEAWVERFPQTEVVSSVTGWDRDYTRYPYGVYEDLDEPPFLPLPFDEIRPPKERVMGIEGAGGGFLALPFLALDAKGPIATINVEVDGDPFVVFWNRAAESAVAFSRISSSEVEGVGNGTEFTFRVENGVIVDDETGSQWSFTGRAMSGPSAGLQIPVYAPSLIAFWFAWSAFHPTTALWTQ